MSEKDRVFVDATTKCVVYAAKFIHFKRNLTNGIIAMLQTRTDVKAVPCERCRIIRSFIMFVIMLVLLALVAGDKLAYLEFSKC